MRAHFKYSVLLSVIALCTACEYPRDARDTTDRIRNGTVRVGVIAHPPWTIIEGKNVSGVDAHLMTVVAKKFNAKIEYVKGPEAELLHALHEGDLHAVIGGFTAKDHALMGVGITRPFYEDSVVLTAAAGTVLPRTLDELEVAILRGSSHSAAVRKADANPVEVEDIDSVSGYAAMPLWRASSMQRSYARKPLVREKHVLATAPGENAFLMAIDRTLIEQKSAIPALLRATPGVEARR